MRRRNSSKQHPTSELRVPLTWTGAFSGARMLMDSGAYPGAGQASDIVSDEDVIV